MNDPQRSLHARHVKGADRYRHWCGEKGGLVLGRVRGAHLRESLLPHPGQGRDASFCRDTPYLVITRKSLHATRHETTRQPVRVFPKLSTSGRLAYAHVWGMSQGNAFWDVWESRVRTCKATRLQPFGVRHRGRKARDTPPSFTTHRTVRTNAFRVASSCVATTACTDGVVSLFNE